MKFFKKSSIGRHWILWRVRIVALIPKRTETDRKGPKMCPISPVTCHLSLTPTATATEHFAANSPIMHCRLICKEHKKKLTQKTLKKNRQTKTLTIPSLTRSLQSTRKQFFNDGTDKHRHIDDSWTMQVRDWIGATGNSLKIYIDFLIQT